MNDDVQPQPKVWPECSTCDAAYVLRRALSITTGKWEWYWQRDCKHKSDPRLVDERDTEETTTGASLEGTGAPSPLPGQPGDPS